MSPDLYAAIILEALKLINKIWDDTPEADRRENMQRWYDFLDKIERIFDGD